jgi:hypothetical protein
MKGDPFPIRRPPRCAVLVLVVGELAQSRAIRPDHVQVFPLSADVKDQPVAIGGM